MKKFTGQQQENFLALVCGDVKILPPLVVGKLVRAALRALRRQESYGVKAVLEPDQDELQLLLGKKTRHTTHPVNGLTGSCPPY
ncbi:TPA: hypothetical protein PP061_002406 [Salmonella bongori]|uniref:Ornithine cyclodeaminase n=1 Tax=Salmonella bongori N268-08 TaxID=1197719 RepID=S5NB95_SALBN|nr:hypothetical protein [Salmonella bongori]AGR59915.1 Ornithine cyclodeaminase [Salmonella bongori N268-08]EIU0395087.1 hypothetical protein [Salmonella bongori]HDJ2742713.1 hypothetical protein [Salmonella bongori]HDJ2746427.1 hypothetical protein [Salmonella bongori]HDJ2756248.1 hypothetical protein [Salmonella bongori]